MASVFKVNCPSFRSLVLATRGEVIRRPAREPTALSTDSREDLTDACFLALTGESFDGHAFLQHAATHGAVMCIIERALSSEELARLPDGFGVLRVASTRAALGLIAHTWRKSILRLRVIAITGSAGKTTTRRLLEGVCAQVGVAHASPKSFNNDIGVPLTLLSTPDEANFLVAEIGMNHPGEILPLTEMCEPEVAIITLAGRAHLEGMGSIEAVAREKASILEGVSRHGIGVINGDNPPLMDAVRALLERDACPQRIVTFGVGPACEYRLIAREVTASGQTMTVRFPASCNWFEEGEPRTRSFDLSMAGEHNARNAIAALAAACEMGFDEASIARGLKGVASADMRLERLEIAQRAVYNDAYNANPDAMIASLAAFAELTKGVARKVVILGEMRELGATARALHEEVGLAAARTVGANDAIIAVGPHADALVQAARTAGFAGDSLHAATFSEAFAADAAALAPIGCAILLKGSRGARMERFLDPLRTAFAAHL